MSRGARPFDAGTAPCLADTVRYAVTERFPDDAFGIRVHVEPGRGARLVRCRFDERSVPAHERTALDFRIDDLASEAWICNVCVAPSRRGRGIGTRLAGVVETTARRLGLGRVRLLPLRGTEAFWKALGYAPAGSPAHAREKRLTANRGQEGRRS